LRIAAFSHSGAILLRQTGLHFPQSPFCLFDVVLTSMHRFPGQFSSIDND